MEYMGSPMTSSLKSWVRLGHSRTGVVKYLNSTVSFRNKEIPLFGNPYIQVSRGIGVHSQGPWRRVLDRR